MNFPDPESPEYRLFLLLRSMIAHDANGLSNGDWPARHLVTAEDADRALAHVGIVFDAALTGDPETTPVTASMFVTAVGNLMVARDFIKPLPYIEEFEEDVVGADLKAMIDTVKLADMDASLSDDG